MAFLFPVRNFAALLFSAGVIANAFGADAIEWRQVPGANRLEARLGNKLVMVYAFGSNQFKPYVKELYTVTGDNILRDAPSDHLHHHGLMYAIRLNGVNFWEERDQPGYQRHVQWLALKSGTSDHLPQAVCTELIHWVATQDAARTDTTAAALMIEKRTLILKIAEKQQEVALQWQSDFEAGPAARPLKLHGSAYNGLGLRLPEAWDHAAAHRNSENRPYTAEQKWDVTPAHWSAVSRQIAGREITVVLFGDPRNRGETRFFSMLNPFAYLSVTQNLEKAPLEYEPGQKFSLNYLVLAYPDSRDEAFVENRYRHWTSAITR